MDYTIPLNRIKDGENDYNFCISKDFFDIFSDEEISSGDLKLQLVINKTYKGLECKINIVGNVKVACDRCLDELFEKIDFTGKLFFEFGDTTEELTDELIRLSYEESEIDFSEYFFECIKLSLPFQKIHPTDKNGKSLCNKEMIKRIEEFENKNKEQKIDPRWEQLQKLKTKN